MAPSISRKCLEASVLMGPYGMDHWAGDVPRLVEINSLLPQAGISVLPYSKRSVFV